MSLVVIESVKSGKLLNRIFAVVILFCIAFFHYYGYSWMLKKENWVRMVLAVMYFPLGLYLLFSEILRFFYASDGRVVFLIMIDHVAVSVHRNRAC